MIKYFLLWFPMLVLAILNGVLRDLGYKKFLGELVAHQLSTFCLLIILGWYIYFVIRKYPPHSTIESLNIGVIWLILTLVFEFGFGLYNGLSWTILLTDYNILKGRIWILIPIWITIAPYLVYRYLSK